MGNSLSEQLLQIKYDRNNHRESPNLEGKFPGWNTNFEKLLDDLNNRKRLLDSIISLHGHSENSALELTNQLDEIIPVFKQVDSLRFFETNEWIIAQQSLMLVYGIRICGNLFPKIKTREEAAQFYELYCVLWRATEGLLKAIRQKCEYWDKYFFKIGIYWIMFSKKVKQVNSEFFSLDEGYGMHLVGFFSSTNIHTNSFGTNLTNGYYSLNPIYLIVHSVVTTQITNLCIYTNLLKSVTDIIESDFNN